MRSALFCLIMMAGALRSHAQHHPEGRQNFSTDVINRMIEHYGNNNVHKEGIIVEFTREDLIQFLNQTSDDKVRMFVVAYPGDHEPNIVVQISNDTQNTGLLTRKTLSYSYYQGRVVCPPPSGSCIVQ
jgi:hypothetical protein